MAVGGPLKGGEALSAVSGHTAHFIDFVWVQEDDD
jgi:hypothetical protein